MDFDKIAKDVVNRLEKFNNKNKETWKEVFDKELNNIEGLKAKDRDLVLIRIVREISKRGYSIEDCPFKLTRF